MTSNDDVSERLGRGSGTQLPDRHRRAGRGARQGRVRPLGRDRSSLTVAWTADGSEHREDVVVRMRPPEAGAHRAVRHAAPVRDPARARGHTGALAARRSGTRPPVTVLGREFVRDGAPRRGGLRASSPTLDLETSDGRLGRMCESMIEQLVAIHTVDLDATRAELRSATVTTTSTRELDHWADEIEPREAGPAPRAGAAARRAAGAAAGSRPAVTLVHGDPKLGNFAFVDDEVTAVFDWEMADDRRPAVRPGLHRDAVEDAGSHQQRAVLADGRRARRSLEELSGIPVHDRAWYRAFQPFKIASSSSSGPALRRRLHRRPALRQMAEGTLLMTPMALADLGVEEQLDPGPVRAPRGTPDGGARPGLLDRVTTRAETATSLFA